MNDCLDSAPPVLAMIEHCCFEAPVKRAFWAPVIRRAVPGDFPPWDEHAARAIVTSMTLASLDRTMMPIYPTREGAFGLRAHLIELAVRKDRLRQKGARMPKPKADRSRTRPLLAVVALILVLALVGTACSKKSSNQTVGELLNKGLKAHASGDIAEASENYKEVLKKDPKNKFALYNLGLIDQQAGKIESAEKYYRRALKTDPDFGSALFNLAILITGPAPQEALELYKHAIALDPANASAHLNLGFLLKSLGRAEEGDGELQRAVELDPTLAARVSPPQPSPSPTPAN